MTSRSNARLAGIAFLVYIAAGIGSMVLTHQATLGAEGNAATLTALANHPSAVRLSAVLTFVCFLCAVALGVTLYALTREEDPHLALLGLLCRSTEGVINAMAVIVSLQVLAIATASIKAAGADAAALQSFGASMLEDGGSYSLVSATSFSLGSTIFSWLFLRARSIPVWLAWVGVIASVVLAIGLLLQMAGVWTMPGYLWAPMALFEVVLAVWLIAKGVRPVAGGVTHPTA